MIIIQGNSFDVSDLMVEMVERKGIGHPDTLADLIAEEFSNRYSRYCLDKFGIVLNHWVDKVCLKGGTTKLDFGSFVVEKPIRIYLFGRLTESFGTARIDILSLFKETVSEVFSNIFFDLPILDYVEYIIDTNWAVGTDHPRSFYFPDNRKQLNSSWDLQKSNDTVMCNSFAPYTFSEKLSIDVENYINSKKFKSKYPETGWDVKVLIVRSNERLDVTVCVPFISSRTSSYSHYSSVLDTIKKDVTFYISNVLEKAGFEYDLKFKINTKDRGEHVFLTAFGTALDKGDYGAVGRGNRYQGLISINRGSNVEAVSGKNPMNHSGKLFTILANEIAWSIYQHVHTNNDVNISINNGDDLLSPSIVSIRCKNKINKTQELKIRNIIGNKLKKVSKFYESIINEDVLSKHREQPNILIK